MILFLAFFVSTQTLGSNAYPPDADCQNYDGGSTMAMSECFQMQSDIWEKRLNLEYRAAMKRAEVDPGKLRTGQRAWLRYRDANCDTYYSVEGTIHTILTGLCWRDMTRARTLELRDMSWTG